MPKVRRTVHAFFYLEDDHLGSLAAALRGDVAQPRLTRIVALAMLVGERHALERAEFELLQSIPADRWVDDDDMAPEQVDALARRGLLITDSDEERLSRLRERDKAVDANEWNLYAALYHFMTQWSGVEPPESGEDPELASDHAREAARAVLSEHGPPPGPFPDVASGPVVTLPGTDRRGELYDTLVGRCTTRAFDPKTQMTLPDFDTIMRYVFGTHGFARSAADVVCIKRTSPSGGGLHPVDVYPIVTSVEGVQPGIYRYDARSHSLVGMSSLTVDEARDMTTSFMAGQRYFGTAHVSFVLTARFYRNHWKYRRHQKAYAGILMDAAHLSQTLYLVSTQLGLGSFVTIAINARDIEQRLGLDGVGEGVIAMTGCGPRATHGSPLDLRFSPEPLD